MVEKQFHLGKRVVLAFWALGCVLSFPLEAGLLDLYFWPTALVQHDPDRDGALFGWPNFGVTLHEKSAHGEYVQALIDNSRARELAKIFMPKLESPIQITRNEESGSWGVTIPGGSSLRTSNIVLLEPMVQDFIACLGVLSENELDRMKEIIYQPSPFVSGHGALIDDERKNIATKMYATYQSSRCKNSTTAVPELVKSKSRDYFRAMLVGRGNGVDINDGALLVISKVFNELLFTPKGIFVRVTLAKIQEFISERIKSFPNPSQARWFNRDYDSFIDYILLTRGREGFIKEHYLQLGEACGIFSAADAFKPFPLKQFIDEGRLLFFNLHLGVTDSMVAFSRRSQ